MEADVKTCSRCKEVKEVTEFNKHKGNIDGLQYNCNACRKAISAKYYDRTKEVQAEKSRRWREANIDRVKARGRKYYQENKEKILQRQKGEGTKAYMRSYYLAHKDEIDTRVKSWAKQHPEEARLRRAKWRESHREQHRESARSFATKVRTELRDGYIKQIFNNSIGNKNNTVEIPKELIEAKRLQILIKRRVKDEERNTVKR